MVSQRKFAGLIGKNNFYMRLLIFTTQDKFFLSHIVERAQYFQKKGWKVGVVVQITSHVLKTNIEKKGFEVFDSKIVRGSINPFAELTALVRLLSAYFNFAPDLVWHLGAKPIAYGTLIARILRLTKPVGVINAPIGLGFVYASNSLRARLLRPIVDLLYRISLNPRHSRVIVENFDDIDSFVKKGFLNRKDAFCILGAGVDTSVFVHSNKQNEICTVVMAARLIREKGVWDFVKAAELLQKDKVRVRMLLVGEPDYGNPSSITRKDFEKIQKKSAVECLGFQSNMDKILGQADIFCLPSFYREGLPRVLVEASSCGLVLLTTDTVGCRETVRDNNGFLFKPHDVKKLVFLIKYLVNNPDERKRMSQNSRKVALQYFDTKKICVRTSDIFNGLWEDIQSSVK